MADVNPRPPEFLQVRAAYRLAALLVALVGTGWSLYSGSINDSANTRRIDEAIKRVDARLDALDQTDQRLWRAIDTQRKEIKDDLRYEQEHGK